MSAVERTFGCMEVSDIGEAKRHYQQDLRCQVRTERGACATLDCQDSALYICQAPKEEVLSKAPHDELDEVADAFWCEQPGYC